MHVAAGASVEVELTFRPDVIWDAPFREDLVVFAGDNTVAMSLCVTGRVWSRQLVVTPSSPKDEAFMDASYQRNEQWRDVHKAALVSGETRKITSEARSSVIGLEMQAIPSIVLEFPDPFDSKADPKTFVAPDPKAKAAAKPGSRAQVKKLTISSIKLHETRSASTANGSFEIIASRELKESGLWSFSIEKGAVAHGASVTVDVTCTQTEPKGIGGLVVGSWKSFSFGIALKGGYVLEGSPDESRVELAVRAFIRL
jgi:hypothetical protein